MFDGPSHGQGGGREQLGDSVQTIIPRTPNFGQMVKDLVGNGRYRLEVPCGGIFRGGIGLEEVLYVLYVGDGPLESSVVLQGQGGDKAGIVV